MTQNNISIVTGTLNRLSILEEVINNTAMRSDKLELVLLDGGSTDGTIEYVKGLNCERINLIEIGERSSYPNFMNIGIRAAKYDWIAQWNDDVLLINEWEDVFNLIDGADAYIFDWTRGSLDDLKNSHIKTINPSDFGSYWITFHDCMNFGLYKKSIFKEIGLYDNKFKYYECDHDMTTRCLFFGYNVVNAHDIKVFEIQTEKRSLNYDEDRILYIQNREFYSHKRLPTTVEKL
jgi:glycosyltransferase involved in cell wall biosynthesis